MGKKGGVQKKGSAGVLVDGPHFWKAGLLKIIKLGYRGQFNIHHIFKFINITVCIAADPQIKNTAVGAV